MRIRDDLNGEGLRLRTLAEIEGGNVEPKEEEKPSKDYSGLIALLIMCLTVIACVYIVWG